MKRKEKTRAAGRADALLFAAVVLLAAMADIPVPVMAEGQETAADAGILMDYSGHSEGGLTAVVRQAFHGMAVFCLFPAGMC